MDWSNGNGRSYMIETEVNEIIMSEGEHLRNADM